MNNTNLTTVFESSEKSIIEPSKEESIQEEPIKEEPIKDKEKAEVFPPEAGAIKKLVPSGGWAK